MEYFFFIYYHIVCFSQLPTLTEDQRNLLAMITRDIWNSRNQSLCEGSLMSLERVADVTKDHNASFQIEDSSATLSTWINPRECSIKSNMDSETFAVEQKT